MKIRRDTLELALATAKDSEVPLWLAGDEGVITDVVIACYDDAERCAIPFGMLRYGKVVTKHDPFRGPGCNLIVEGNRWRFVDDCGDPVTVDLLEPPGESG